MENFFLSDIRNPLSKALRTGILHYGLHEEIFLKGEVISAPIPMKITSAIRLAETEVLLAAILKSKERSNFRKLIQRAFRESIRRGSGE